MKKQHYKIECATIKTTIEAINPQEAFVIAVRQAKFPDLSPLFRFKNLEKKHRPENLWHYQDTEEVLSKYGLLVNL